MTKFFVVLACVFAMTAIMLGAFAAHGLKNTIAPSQLGVFQTGVTYQFYHALGLLFMALLFKHTSSVWFLNAGYLFIAGVAFFSTSLYALSLGGPKWLGPITPVGGVCFIAGWASAMVGAIKSL